MTSNSDIQPGILAEMKKVWGNGLTTIFSTPGSLRVGPDNIANIHLGKAGSKSYEESAP